MSSRLAQHREHVCFNDVRPKREKNCRSVVHNEHGGVGCESFNDRVVAGALEDSVLIDEVESLDWEGFVLAQGAIHGIAVKASDWLAAVDQKFG